MDWKLNHKINANKVAEDPLYIIGNGKKRDTQTLGQEQFLHLDAYLDIIIELEVRRILERVLLRDFS